MSHDPLFQDQGSSRLLSQTNRAVPSLLLFTPPCTAAVNAGRIHELGAHGAIYIETTLQGPGPQQVRLARPLLR
jgi:hypothetical protein